MKDYPNCIKCHKSPFLHALIGVNLACAWDGRKVKVKGYFGPYTDLIVADVYKTLGEKTPHKLVDKVIELRKKGINTW